MVQEGGDPCDSLCPPQQPPDHELNEEDCAKPSSGMPEILQDDNASVMSHAILHECLSCTVPECWMLHAHITAYIILSAVGASCLALRHFHLACDGVIVSAANQCCKVLNFVCTQDPDSQYVLQKLPLC